MHWKLLMKMLKGVNIDTSSSDWNVTLAYLINVIFNLSPYLLSVWPYTHSLSAKFLSEQRLLGAIALSYAPLPFVIDDLS